MKGSMDWNGYMPEEVQTEPEPPVPARAVRITPDGARPFVVELEWDDGNGMWISHGVSR